MLESSSSIARKLRNIVLIANTRPVGCLAADGKSAVLSTEAPARRRQMLHADPAKRAAWRQASAITSYLDHPILKSDFQ
jgi:hypothetical protein